MGHATVLIALEGARLLTDPLLRGRLGHLRRHGPPPAAEVTRGLDAVLISHLHLDHLDFASLRRLPRDLHLIVPRGAGALLRRQGFSRVDEVSVGDRIEVAGVPVAAVRADHDGRRRPFGGGPKAETLGYVIGDARRVYFAGDTDLFAEMAEFAPLDVALVPVWGWGPSLGSGHMDPLAAARAVAMLRPRVAVPIHWGTFFPAGLARLRGSALVDPPREFARHARELAPDVEVRVLAPGGTLALDAR